MSVSVENSNDATFEPLMKENFSEIQALLFGRITWGEFCARSKPSSSEPDIVQRLRCI